jgi:hypothetical protein
MHDVEVIEDPAAASSALDPIRSRLLTELVEPGSAAALAARAAIDRALGAGEVGSPVEVLGLSGRVKRGDDIYLDVGVTAPVPGYLALFALDKGDGVTSAVVTAGCSARARPSSSRLRSRPGATG